MTQKRLDQLIVAARRRHKAKMERLRLAFLGKRAELEFEGPQPEEQPLPEVGL